MFRATESGYNEFRNQLIRRVIQSLVDDNVSSTAVDADTLRETIGLDLSDLYWDRIPESHYSFIADIAADDEFYVPDHVSFTQDADDVIEQIAFAALIDDTYDEFMAVQDHNTRLIERTKHILDVHDDLDTLINEEVFRTPSDAVDAFYPWVDETRDSTIGLSEFSERNIRRQKALPIRFEVVDAVGTWADAQLDN